MDKAPNTSEQFDRAMERCHDIFHKKLQDYGPSWRIMRPATVTDQLLIKAMRIRSLQQMTDGARVDEGILPELLAIVNYGIVALLQLKYSFDNQPKWNVETADSRYMEEATASKALMMDKNHDYGEAWRHMRVSSMVDLILTKLYRIKQIEDNDGHTVASEGVEGNYQDIINYAIFCIIKETEG